MRYLKNILALLLLVAVCGCPKTNKSPSEVDAGRSGSMARFAINGNYLYTVDQSSLKVFSISNPAAPSFISAVKDLVSIETIFVRDDSTLFLGSIWGMNIYDIKNPLNPVFLSQYSHALSCDPVVADSAFAYVTLRTGTTCARGLNQFDVVNIKDLPTPVLSQSYLMDNPKGLALDDSLLLICDDSLKIYDRTDSPIIKHLKSYAVKANDIIADQGHYILIGDDGIFQYQNTGTDLTYLSKITIQP